MGNHFFLGFYLFIYNIHIEKEREAETQAEGEAGSMWGARCGTRSWTPGSQLEPKAGAQPLSHPGDPPRSFKSSCQQVDYCLNPPGSELMFLNIRLLSPGLLSSVPHTCSRPHPGCYMPGLVLSSSHAFSPF